MDVISTLSLNSWRDLNKMIGTLSEGQLMDMIKYEAQSSEPRRNLLLRMHQKLTILRMKRERKELGL